jgi:hypothetical protein
MSSESKSRVVYENLDTTFVNLWALLRKLSQRGFIGRVHVELKDYTADVFMSGSSTPLVREIDRAAGTDTTEQTALHRLVLRVRETPGTISVFEGEDEAAVQGGAALETRPAGFDHRPVASPPVTEADVAEPGRRSGEEPAEPASPGVEPIDEIEWGAILKASGELVGGIERALNGTGADFQSLFNRARLDLADDYAFLDPMSGQFNYSNSVVTNNAEVPLGPYVIALTETLRRVVDGVATGDRARRVRERVALELLAVARRRREILDRSGFLSQLDRIAGTKVV